MKKWNIFFFIFIFAMGIGFSATITVTSPDQDSVWTIGQSPLITWTTSGEMQNFVRIELYKGLRNLVSTISESTNNDGSFEWEIPQTIHPGFYFLKIRTEDALVTGVSAVFEIAAPVINRPDLEVSVTRVSPRLRYVNEPITFYIVVKNVGNRPSNGCRGRFKVYGPRRFRTRTYPFDIPDLAVNQLSKENETYTVPKHGFYNNVVELDINNDIYEITKRNNKKNHRYTVNPEKRPDLIVCIRSGGCIRINTKKKVWASVRNIGQAPSTPCRLRFYIKQNDVKFFSVPDLDPGEHVVFYREPIWRTKGVKTMKAIVDYDKDVTELREGNNKVTGHITAHLPFSRCKAGIATKKCSSRR